MDQKDLTKTGLRFGILVLASLACFGSYFVYDNPAALQTQLQNSLHIDEFEFNLFFSVYSFPNILLPIFGGYLIDVIGPRILVLALTLFIAAGQCIFTFGIMLDSYPVALLGRVVFGMGGESLNVTLNYFISAWFKGKELSMGLGSFIGASRLGSVANDNIEPTIVFESGSLSLGLWIAFLVCVFSFACAVFLSYVDLVKDRRLGIKERFHLTADEKFKLSDLKSFGPCFWFVCLNCFTVYIDITCFNNIASNYFQERFGYTSIEAGRIFSITYLVAALMCPFFGIFVDKIGRRAYFIIFSSVAVTLVHVAFILTAESSRPIYPIFYMVVLGLGYSIYASVIWASIPLLIEGKATGTAFGINTSFLNLGLTIGPIIVGLVQKNTQKDKGYYWVSFFLIIVGIIGITSSIAIYILDRHNGGILTAKASSKTIDNSNLHELKERLTIKEATN